MSWRRFDRPVEPGRLHRDHLPASPAGVAACVAGRGRRSTLASLPVMSSDEVVLAFVNRGPVPGVPDLTVDADALTVDGWWPAALWLGSSTCLVRLDESTQPALAGALAEALGATGLVVVDADMDAPVEAVTIHRLGLMGAHWQVWSTDTTTARSSIAEAASG